MRPRSVVFRFDQTKRKFQVEAAAAGSVAGAGASEPPPSNHQPPPMMTTAAKMIQTVRIVSLLVPLASDTSRQNHPPIKLLQW